MQNCRCEQIVSCRAVAASDVNKYGWTPALQDNVEIWLTSLKAAHPWTEILWASEWINIKHKLVSLIALAFSVIWDQVCTCLAQTNIVTTVSFFHLQAWELLHLNMLGKLHAGKLLPST